jgi:SAM-dependent methyltransferase
MSESASDREPKNRFSNRVAYYVRYRPGYPVEMRDWLVERAELTDECIVADIGSGTGLLAELFLQNGNRVYGVEPNPQMRAAGEKYLSHYPLFSSFEGAAEATTLDSDSIDMISVGQAFHWFEVEATRREFARILRPGGRVVLAWNSPRKDASPFMEAYQQIWHHLPLRPPEPQNTVVSLPESTVVSIPKERGQKARLFGSNGFEFQSFANQQEFDWAGLKGRLLSESSAPLPGDSRYLPMMEELEDVFTAHQENGQIVFLYDTEVYWGMLDRGG